jgi:hypothetical protein
MKQISMIILGIAFFTICYSQNDSLNKPIPIVRPLFENGVAFISNDYLKETYKTNTMYYWGIGFRIGDSRKDMVLPYLKYTNASYITRFEEKYDSTLSIQEFLVGADIIIKRFNSNMFKAKIGYIYSKINDDFSANSDYANGLQVGFGYEAKVFRNSRVFLDYSYDFLKLSKAIFRDYDIQKVTIGFII